MYLSALACAIYLLRIWNAEFCWMFEQHRFVPPNSPSPCVCMLYASQMCSANSGTCVHMFYIVVVCSLEGAHSHNAMRALCVHGHEFNIQRKSVAWTRSACVCVCENICRNSKLGVGLNEEKKTPRVQSVRAQIHTLNVNQDVFRRCAFPKIVQPRDFGRNIGAKEWKRNGSCYKLTRKTGLSTISISWSCLHMNAPLYSFRTTVCDCLRPDFHQNITKRYSQLYSPPRWIQPTREKRYISP